MEMSMGKIPSAMIPPVMSLAAVWLALFQLVVQVVAPDLRPPRAIAYLWLLLIVAQMPVIALFASGWLRRTPWQARKVLVVQFLAAATALVPMHSFGW